MSNTSRLGLSYWPELITSADIPANDNARMIDAILGATVISATTSAEPGSPTNGQVYIIPSGATGTNWAGQSAGTIAHYEDGWEFYAPKRGLIAEVQDTGDLLFYKAAWTSLLSLLGAEGAQIASAGTTDIGAATGQYVDVTGTTTITALGTIRAGVMRFVRFTGILTLTHNASSLILPGGANITTAADDCAIFVSEGSGNWRCLAYQRAASAPGGGLSDGDKGDITVSASGATWTIDADAVAYGKMQNASRSSILLGRGNYGSPGDGNLEEITLGTGLTMTGTTLSASSGSGDVVGPASATDNAIPRFDTTTGKLLQDSSITISDLSGSSVTLAVVAGNALVIDVPEPAATTGASVAGKSVTLRASDAVASTDTAGAAAGGSKKFQAGNAARLTSGNADAGHYEFLLASGIGTGVGAQILQYNQGTAARPAFAWDISGNRGYGLYYAAGVIGVSVNGSQVVGFNNGGILMAAGANIVGNATTASQMYGFMRGRFDLTSSTTLTSPHYNGATLTNFGAGAAITSTLISAAAKYYHRFIDDNAGGFRWTIKPNTGDTIIWTDGTVVTAATGSIVSTARYDAFDVECLDTTVWLARNVRGTWTVTA